MIDFRYHLVSLISVFIALAVGIVLGAGPLRDTLGDQLTGQVDALRTEKEELRVELGVTQTELAQREAFIEAASGHLLAQALLEWRVALVRLPGVEDSEVEGVVSRLEQAGASVVSRVEVDPRWVEPGLRAYRSQLSVNLATYLAESPAENASVERVLGLALGTALTAVDPASPEDSSEEADVIIELLGAGDQPLLSRGEETLVPAHAVITLTPDHIIVEDATPTPGDDDVLAAWVALVATLGEAGEAALAFGAADSDGDVLAAVRSDSAGALAGTLDGAGSLSSQVSAPLALAWMLAGGQPAHWGSGLGATAVLPDEVELGTPPVPEPQVGEDGEATAETDAEAEETESP